jgi:predicted permease
MNLLGNVKIAVRLAVRRPGLTVARLFTVMLVVTAVSTVFTVANVTFLKPLPFPTPDRLVRVYLQPSDSTDFADSYPFYPLAFQYLRDNITQLRAFEGIWTQNRAVQRAGNAESILAGRVSAGFFPLLGARFVKGRGIQQDDVQRDAKVVVLGNGLWQRKFGGDPQIIGQTLTIDREPYEIIGVTAKGFEPDFTDTEFWTPLFIRTGEGNPIFTSVQSIGLVPENGSKEKVETELNALLRDLRGRLPVLEKDSARIINLRQANFGATRPALWTLLSAVCLLGLLAAANLANLTLADLESRRSDFAVATALGATRMHLAKPEVALSLMLSLLGGATGLLIASVLAPAALILDPSGVIDPRLAVIDWRVAIVAFGFSLFVMLAALAAPVLHVAKASLVSELAAAGKGAITNLRAERTRLSLVILQTALAVLLLFSGALIVKTLQRTAAENPGFDSSNVLTAQLQLSSEIFPKFEDRAMFIERILDKTKEIPGIVEAATTLNPFQPGFGLTTFVEVSDRPSPDGQPYTVQYRRISPGYFATMKIRMIAGRDFDNRDRSGVPTVAIVSRAFAKRFWPNEDPIGKRIKRGPAAAPWSMIVGVVDDVRDQGLHQTPVETLYTAYYQGNSPATPVALIARTQGDPERYLDSIRKAISEVDATQPLASVITLQHFLSRSLGPQRFRAFLVGSCGTLGFLLALIGIYGVTARSVAERRKETGIRLALGGRPYAVWWTMAWRSVRAVVAGALVGIAASFLARIALAALLPEIQTPAWLLAAFTAISLVTVGIFASLIAARSAITVEPVRALRSE